MKRTTDKTLSKQSAVALFALAAALTADDATAAEWFTPHCSASFGINSSYISRGKVYEDTPIQENEFDVRFDLGDYGYVGVNHWNYSCLSDKYTDKYRAAFPEFDWMPYCGYDWKFADGWSLDSQVRLMWKAYYGGIPEDDQTGFELYLHQSVKSPYATLFYAYRSTFEPDKWSYFLVGLKRTFTVCRHLRLTPRVTTDFADALGRRKRFGALPDGGSYGCGILSIVAELRADIPISDWFSLYAAVGQFGVLSRDGRDNLDEHCQRDLTYGKAGITLSF